VKTSHLFLFAYRYLRGTKKENTVNTMIKICFAGIAIGTFSLALIFSIMYGFEKATHEKLQGINAQIIMGAEGQDLDYEKISNVLSKEYSGIVAAHNPCSTQHIIIQDEQGDKPTAVILKGIDPKKEPSVTVFSKKIIQPKSSTQLETMLKNDCVIIGEKLAEQNKLKCGSTFDIFFATEQTHSSKTIQLDKKHVTVGGIFKTGIEEYDSATILCSLSLLKKIFQESQVNTIEMKLYPHVDETQTIKNIKNRFGIDTYSWKSLYPALVSALKLEKYAMFFILLLITLVASMNIISLLFMLITHKQCDISILQSMGISQKDIFIIFLLIGLVITALSGAFGIIAALVACIILKKYPFISLPDIYYVTHLPVVVEWHIFALVFISVIILGLIASLIPVQKIKKLNIARILSFER
jgi:lipoprotein-releasing system permease protein